MNVQVNRNPEYVAEIKARSERAPERDHHGIECWREGSLEHYFVDGGTAYLHTLAWMPTA